MGILLWLAVKITALVVLLLIFWVASERLAMLAKRIYTNRVAKLPEYIEAKRDCEVRAREIRAEVERAFEDKWNEYYSIDNAGSIF